MVLTRAANQPGPDGSPATVRAPQDESRTTSRTPPTRPRVRRPEPDLHLAPRRTRCSSASTTLNGAGDPVGDRHDCSAGEGGEGLATWAAVKAQARDMLGIDLTDTDVLNVPLLATDPYGNFLPGRQRLRPAGASRAGCSRATPAGTGRSPPTRSGPGTRSSTTSPTTRCRPATRQRPGRRPAARRRRPPDVERRRRRRPGHLRRRDARRPLRRAVTAGSTRTSGSPPCTTSSTPSTTGWSATSTA